MSPTYDVVIVGAGHGGVNLATLLVKENYPGSIALLSDESVIPYERPPLSKGYLTGEQSFEDIVFRPAEYWEKSPVELRLNTRVTEVRPDRQVVVTADGATITYRRLVWAAGGRARRLPVDGAELLGVHSIRRLGDLATLKEELAAAKRAVIIGGGYIGLETAAAFRAQGIDVTVVEVQDRLLARVTSPEVSQFFLERHRAAGVTVRLGVGVQGLRGEGGRVRAVVLANGAELPADLVVVGIGLVPNTEVLAAAGATVSNGIEVDEYCRTSLPNVSALGDCANHVNEFAGGARVRLESVQNATDQARTVALDLLGAPAPYRATPWFWSNQYDIKLKTAGIVAGYDHAVVRGEPAQGRFSVVYLADSRVVALDSVNTPADFMVGRKLVQQRRKVDPEMVADPRRPLKQLLAAEG